jgi:hypothetical protein
MNEGGAGRWSAQGRKWGWRLRIYVRRLRCMRGVKAGASHGHVVRRVNEEKRHNPIPRAEAVTVHLSEHSTRNKSNRCG